MKSKITYSPSVITLNMCKLLDQVRELENSGIDTLHIDIIDGQFSPSLPLGLETVKQLRKETNMYFDCHIMANNYDYLVDELISIGVNQIVFQIETADHIDGLLNKIHNAGIDAGVALKPATSLSTLDYILDKCDTVMLMLINPGYASSSKESQVPYADKKIRDLRNMIEKRNLKTKISIDGRVSYQNIQDYGNGLVDIFVLGTTCLSKDKLTESVRRLF